MLGFTEEEVNRKFDDFVEFAALKNFIDTPVQNYSSGMKVRLDRLSPRHAALHLIERIGS
jgi:ABC-type polysaccharide/polyol phosphate transport system ATPase subunit